MLINTVCIVGGSGFVGQRLANRLSAEGLKILIPTRNRERHRGNLILLPEVQLIHANVHDEQQLCGLFETCDAVINLSGILNERSGSNQGFRQVHVDLTAKIINAIRRTGVKRLLHMSALNASVNGSSQYLRTKGEAEQLVLAASDIHTTCYQPSVIFGPGDSFFNRFARLLRIAPVLPLACPQARFTPVYVGDVAEAMALTLSDPAYYNKRLQLGGPDQLSLEQLVRYTADCLGIKRLILPLPDTLSRAQAEVIDLWSFLFNLLGIDKPFSTDNYLSLQTDSVCSTADLAGLGITATPVGSVVPSYLASINSTSRYDQYRQLARR